jgi:hypothetical protein
MKEREVRTSSLRPLRNSTERSSLILWILPDGDSADADPPTNATCSPRIVSLATQLRAGALARECVPCAVFLALLSLYAATVRVLRAGMEKEGRQRKRDTVSDSSFMRVHVHRANFKKD